MQNDFKHIYLIAIVRMHVESVTENVLMQNRSAMDTLCLCLINIRVDVTAR